MYTAKNAPAGVRTLVALLVGLMAGLPVQAFAPSTAHAQTAEGDAPAAVEANPVVAEPVAAEEPAPTRERRVAVFTFSGKRGMDQMAYALGTLARRAVEDLDGIVVAPSTGVVDGGTRMVNRSDEGKLVSDLGMPGEDFRDVDIG